MLFCEAPDTIVGPDGISSCLVDCSSLLLGQYLCNTTGIIDPASQQPYGCSEESVARISCTAVDGLLCRETESRAFYKEVPCKWTNGYSYSTALLLSVFLGLFGADRLYLGHIGMGTLKCFTMGFMFVGVLVDIILVATENLGPKDGSSLIVGFYGPGVETLRSDNESYIVQRVDWYT